MNLIVPEIVLEGRGLSLAVVGVAIGVGLLLWLFGWRFHRFWIVVAVTVGGGLYGLSAGQATGVNMIAMGIMLALCAGLLALELARVFAFLAAGTALWLAVGLFFPQGRELWLVFLGGGLIGILFYRLWTMLLTSFIGTIIATHAILILIGETTKGDAVTWTRDHAMALSVGIGLLSLLGLAVQGMQERWKQQRTKETTEEQPKTEKLPKDLQALKDAFTKPAK